MFAKATFQIHSEQAIFGFNSTSTMLLLISPAAIALLPFTFTLLSTDGALTPFILRDIPDFLTPVVLICGGLLAIGTFLKKFRQKSRLLVCCFYLGMSAVLLFAGGEEMSWGQTMTRSSTETRAGPSLQQRGSVLKEIQTLRRHLEIYPLTASLIGVVGVWFIRKSYLKRIAVPLILLPWFLVAMVVAGIDLLHDFYRFSPPLGTLVNQMEELSEFIVALGLGFYTWFQFKNSLRT